MVHDISGSAPDEVPASLRILTGRYDVVEDRAGEQARAA